MKTPKVTVATKQYAQLKGYLNRKGTRVVSVLLKDPNNQGERSYVVIMEE
jgi:hypothetical protein